MRKPQTKSLKTLSCKLDNIAIKPEPIFVSGFIFGSIPIPIYEHYNDKNMADQNRILIAKISGSHGVKGLVKVAFFGEDPNLLEAASLFTKKTGDTALSLSVKNKTNKHYLAQIEDINDRDAADALRNTELYIDRSALPDTDDEDTFYIEDLQGIEVRDTQGEKVGILKSVENYGAGDLLNIKPLAGKEFLIPFTKAFTPEIYDDYIVIQNFEEFM